ncbi:hypothetical protein V1264_017981 [Littorina saxatilis]|uniref:C2H2-type domain-containing protein n=1 Tax=Littorina saxatilis TaxID=31220 RepID=A0AAN9BKG6_9CAEN
MPSVYSGLDPVFTVALTQCVCGCVTEEEVPEGRCKIVSEELGRSLYWCPICYRVYSCHYSLNSHVTHVHNTSGVQGKLYSLQLKDAVAKRKLVHEDGVEVTRYRCLACGCLYSSHLAITAHLRMSSETMGLTCRTKCRDGVKIRGKTGEALFSPPDSAHLCTICGKSVTTARSLVHHYQNVHTVQPKNIACPLCPAMFSDPEYLRTHKRRIHGPRRKFYICDTCGKGYMSMTGLKQHVDMAHQGLVKHPCPVCHKMFYPRFLKYHLRIHESNRQRYYCTKCEQSFSSSYNLSVHERIHFGIKPYRCTMCDAAFAQKSSLNVHVRKHGMEIQQPRKVDMDESATPASFTETPQRRKISMDEASTAGSFTETPQRRKVDMDDASTAGNFTEIQQRRKVDMDNAATAGSFPDMQQRRKVDMDNAATAGSFPDMQQRRKVDMDNAATAGSFPDMQQRRKQDMEDAYTAVNFAAEMKQRRKIDMEHASTAGRFTAEMQHRRKFDMEDAYSAGHFTAEMQQRRKIDMDHASSSTAGSFSTDIQQRRKMDMEDAYSAGHFTAEMHQRRKMDMDHASTPGSFTAWTTRGNYPDTL